jgi:DNA (cytosine-5)-methyltransferase 1
LDAQWLGVPQQRQRTIFVGVRNDLNLEPAHPKPLAYRYSVKDALPWIVSEKRGGSPENWQKSDRPASTIVGSGHSLSPTAYLSGGTYVIDNVSTEKRKFSIAELRRICAFPDDFILTGTYSQQWERMGRAVPPVMMSHIAATVRDDILRRIKP